MSLSASYYALIRLSTKRERTYLIKVEGSDDVLEVSLLLWVVKRIELRVVVL